MNFLYNSIRNESLPNALNQYDLVSVSNNISLVANKGTHQLVAGVAQQLIKQNQEMRQVKRLMPRKLFRHCKQCVQTFIHFNMSPLDRLQQFKKTYPQLAIEAKKNREIRRQAWLKEFNFNK